MGTHIKPVLADAIEQIRRKSESSGANIRDQIVGGLYQNTVAITKDTVTYTKNKLMSKTIKIDRFVTSPWLGFPIMLALLGIVFYITIAGAGYPSDSLMTLFFWIEDYITMFFSFIHAPDWLHGILVLGLYRGTAWVVSVMAPPMAIFFPMFALLENYGYLPRVAFNMDRLFQRAGAHGKQALTMAMGFGCNAAAIISTRIIESPRERMLAILTNNFVPCNGRWPILIIMASLFLVAGSTGSLGIFMTSLVLVGMILIGIIVTLIVSWTLSKTLLKGMPTHYTLELPPYRKPKFLNTVIRASVDKSYSVLKRAVIIAAPAGVLTWVFANVYIGDISILMYIVQFFDPVGQALGMDGFILMAFVLGLPANEIVLPILLMGYLATGSMVEMEDLSSLKNIFIDHGWTWLTALNVMLFSLLHYPCGTTLFNIYKETKSPKWTFLAFLIPTSIAIGVTYITTQVVRAFGWV